MIELKFSGMCEGCKLADIDIERRSFYAGENVIDVIYFVRCEHERQCKQQQKIAKDSTQ